MALFPETPSIACARRASTHSSVGTVLPLRSLPEEFQYVPVIDGPGGLIPDLPSTLLAEALLAEGNFSKFPTMTGTNLDDGAHSSLPAFPWFLVER